MITDATSTVDDVTTWNNDHRMNDTNVIPFYLCINSTNDSSLFMYN